MSATRKARSDARLKTLPKDRQEQLWQWINGTEGYKGARRLAREQWGLQTSVTALSEFYSWFALSRHLEEAATFADELKKTLGQLPELNLNEEQVNLAAQVAFELEAIKAKDFDRFFALRKLRQKDSEMTLEREKFELLKRKAEQADQAEKIVESSATPEEKQQRLRAIFGMS